MFYELNTWDPLGTTPWRRSNDDPLNGTFQGHMEIMAQVSLLLDPNAEFTNQEANVTLSPPLPSSTGAAEDIDIQVPNLLPDG